MLISDETTFKLFQHKKKVWQGPGRRAIVRTVKHPMKVHVWGCVSANGFGRCCSFVKNLTGAKMVKIYEKALLPSARTLFGSGPSTWFFQEDNDPKHRCKIATAWKENNNIKNLPWPPQSPDQNCIENVWGVLKANVAARRPKTVKVLRRMISEEWKKLTGEYAQKLVGTMND